MRPLDAERQIKELAGKLNVELLLSKMREYERGDHRTASMSDGRGSAESACPVAVTPERDDWVPRREGAPLRGDGGRVLGVSDPTDRQIRSDRLRVEQALRHVALGLQEITQIAGAWTVPRTDDTEKAKALDETKGGVPCANVSCDRWMTGTQDNRPRHIDGVALCERCYRYTRRTGKSWSPQLEAAEAQRSEAK